MFQVNEKNSAELQKLREALELLAIRVADAELKGKTELAKLVLKTRMLMEHCAERCAALDGVDCRDCEEFGEFLEWLEIKAYERDLEERAEKENYYEGEE